MRGCFDNLKGPKPSPEKSPAQHWYKGPPDGNDSIGWWWTPRVAGPKDYPYDLDFSERITRPKRGIDFFPVPGLMLTSDQHMQFMGNVSGILPQEYVAVIQNASHRPAAVGPKPNANIWSDSLLTATVPQIQLG